MAGKIFGKFIPPFSSFVEARQVLSQLVRDLGDWLAQQPPPTSFGGLVLSDVADPKLSTDVATKGYVDSEIAQSSSFLQKQTLTSYTTNTQSSSYTGINNAQVGIVYAQVSDLNSLRVAYENLRAAYDDLRAKLKSTTLVQ